jgi:hypothetical protein
MNSNSHNSPRKFRFAQTPLVLALRKAFSAQPLLSREPNHQLGASSSENKMRFESLEPRILM